MLPQKSKEEGGNKCKRILEELALGDREVKNFIIQDPDTTNT